MKEIILNNIAAIHVGGAFAKIKSLVVLTTLFSPIPFLIESVTNWAISNSYYIIFVFIAIIIDHILGTLIHLFINRDFSFKKNLVGIIVKVGLVVAVGLLFEGINVILEGENIIKEYLIVLMRMLVFLYPASSAFANSSIITNGKFPPKGFLTKLMKFQENLNVSELKQIKQ